MTRCAPTRTSFPTYFAGSPTAWTWTAVIFSFLVVAAISWIHLAHRRSADELAHLLEHIRIARVDLAKGFLHVSLAGGGDAPFDRPQGLALLGQAMESLRTSVGTATRLGVVQPDEAALFREFEESLVAFRTELTRGGGAADQTRVRSAFYALERRADRIDALIGRALEENSRRLERQFEIATAVAVLLLGVICSGVYFASRGQRRAVEALRESEGRLRRLGDNLPDSYIYEYVERDEGRQLLHVSAGVERIHGVPADDLLRATGSIFGNVHPAYAGALAEAIDASPRSGRDFHIEIPIGTASSDERWLTIRSRPLPQPDGAVIWDGVAADVTAHKKTEHALRESDERFRQLTGSIREVFWLADLRGGEVLYVSPAYETITGRPVSSLLSHPDSAIELVDPDDRDRVKQMLSLGVSAERAEEFRIVCPDGSRRWILGKVFPVRDAAGTTYRLAGIAEDVTERKQLEEQFFQAQRLEALGRVSSGLAHDLNNTLMPIMASTDVLKKTATAPRALEMVAIIESSVRRGADLIRHLLAFARGGAGARALVEPRELVDEIAKMIGPTLPAGISITWKGDSATWPVHADATQMHQVLMNLCVNARDAMPRGGSLVLECRNAIVPESEAGADGAPGRYVAIAVSDTGEGIRRDVLDRIFDPFFTTKPAGKGTGLGLSVVLRIVKAHAGFVKVRSEEATGTSFEVYLPAAGEAAESASLT